MRAELLPLEGGAPIEINKDLIVVGRKPECDVRLDHKSVSKIHCVIVKTDGLLLVRDLGSTNGTRVNGQRIRRAALLPNDQLSIASFKFRVYLGPDAAELPVPAVSEAYEQTQHLDPKEVARLINQAGPDKDNPDDGHDSAELPVLKPFQRNLLPDVYPDEPGKEK
jgi:pSer/pThr/pTyr-binding forkhead associated (FHA) protein